VRRDRKALYGPDQRRAGEGGLSTLRRRSRPKALRLAPHGIGVYEVRPGIIRTAMTAPSAERYEREIAQGLSPIARFGEPSDVGCAVATIATGRLPFSAGQVIHVDGGLSLPRF
jgi:NAD(P)-dependent dehydrogenase (short-subunit alcohol dehydrogenase family)